VRARVVSSETVGSRVDEVGEVGVRGERIASWVRGAGVVGVDVRLDGGGEEGLLTPRISVDLNFGSTLRLKNAILVLRGS